jgi:hypothetical protein
VTAVGALGPAERPGPPSWSEIGESFETLGKVGLAMAIGFSAAGLFCRLAEQGKVKVPSLPAMVLNSRLDPPPRRDSESKSETAT